MTCSAAVLAHIREEGALRARVYGDTVYTWEDSGRVLLFPVKVELFDANGALTGHLTADQGELDKGTGFKATADLREIEMFGTIGESVSGQL